MTRRTKKDMQAMRNFVKLDLLANGNEPHKAHEAMIKEHLMEGKSIPHYIKGVKDYIQVSKELEGEINKKKNIQESNNKREQIKNDILSLSVEEIKAIYKQYKNEVSHIHKINLTDLCMMVMHQDFTGFGNEHINVFTFNDIDINQFKKTA